MEGRRKVLSNKNDLRKTVRKCFLCILAGCILAGNCSVKATAFENGDKRQVKKAGSKKVLPKNPVYGGTAKGEWKGDRVYLGSYEQDGKRANGKEAILWRVLRVEDNKMLLLSEYALDTKAYHEKNEKVTWKNTTIRKWLNGKFFNEALKNQGKWKQSMVLDSVNYRSDNQNYGTRGGKETRDKVFLLAWEDTYNESYGFPKAAETNSNITGKKIRYSEISKARLCYPTLYAAKKNPLITRMWEARENQKGEKVEGFGSIYWILRTPGMTQKYVSYVSRWGKTTLYFRSPADHTESAVRPAIEVDISKLKFKKISSHTFCADINKAYEKKARAGLEYETEIKYALTHEKSGGTYSLKETVKTEIEELKNPVFGGNRKGEWEGDRVYFGKYSWSNEKEGILWRVLSTKNGKLILLAEYGKASMEYGKGGCRWEDSEVRKWLNRDFYKAAFSEKEKKAMKTTKVKNKKNLRYGISSGKDTMDKVFLLSWEECINESYGFVKGEGKKNLNPTQSNTRICYKKTGNMSKMELSRLFEKYDLYGNNIVCGKTHAVSWWLRTAGFQRTYVCDVNVYGDIYHHEQIRSTQRAWVRPVIVVDKSRVKIVGEQNHFPILTAR